MLALLCGLTELGLNHNYWTDIVVGWGLGVAMAIYLGKLRLFPFPFHIPRAHTSHPPIPLYGEMTEHPVDKYKDRPTPNPGYQHDDDQRLSHL